MMCSHRGVLIRRMLANWLKEGTVYVLQSYAKCVIHLCGCECGRGYVREV